MKQLFPWFILLIMFVCLVLWAKDVKTRPNEVESCDVKGGVIISEAFSGDWQCWVQGRGYVKFK